MPFDVKDLMELLCHVSKGQEMEAAFTHSADGALMAETGAFLGGLLAGPLGIAVGAGIGGLLGAGISSGEFKPVPQIILELSPEEKQQFCNEVFAIIENLDWSDVAFIAVLAMKNKGPSQKLPDVITKYLFKEHRAKVKYSH